MQKKKKLLKEKKCRICTFRFIPRATTQVVCSPGCALELNKQKKDKAFNAETRRRKQLLKTHGDHVKATQKIFNAYVRLRDKGQPCISCGRSDKEVKKTDGWKTGGAWDCGHFKTVGGFPELRFNSFNAHKQCKSCNAGSNKYAHKTESVAAEYRVRLIDKLGLERVEWLEGHHEQTNYTKADLVRLANIYKRKIKRLKDKEKCEKLTW